MREWQNMVMIEDEEGSAASEFADQKMKKWQDLVDEELDKNDKEDAEALRKNPRPPAAPPPAHLLKKTKKTSQEDQEFIDGSWVDSEPPSPPRQQAMGQAELSHRLGAVPLDLSRWPRMPGDDRCEAAPAPRRPCANPKCGLLAHSGGVDAQIQNAAWFPDYCCGKCKLWMERDYSRSGKVHGPKCEWHWQPEPSSGHLGADFFESHTVGPQQPYPVAD